jgi:hypothetical protein
MARFLGGSSCDGGFSDFFFRVTTAAITRKSFHNGKSIRGIFYGHFFHSDPTQEKLPSPFGHAI